MQAIFQADARIAEEVGHHPEFKGMSTTLTMAFSSDGERVHHLLSERRLANIHAFIYKRDTPASPNGGAKHERARQCRLLPDRGSG
jgi:hypothetical protein